MTNQPDFTDAHAQLDEFARTVERLHKMCCVPDRSPRMAHYNTALNSLSATQIAKATRQQVEGRLRPILLPGTNVSG